MTQTKKDQDQVPPRWIVREIPDTDEQRRWYVQDSHLGYCTEPATKREAQAEARRLNREQPW